VKHLFAGHVQASSVALEGRLMPAARSITAPMMEAGSVLPSRPMLLAISCGSAPWDETRDHDTGVSQQRIEIGAGSDAMREHLTGSSIRIESNGHGEPAAVVLKLDGFGGTPTGKPLPRHRAPPWVSMAQRRMTE
jgi:hypothetical protein